MASEVEILLRFLLASVFGGVIGLEREIHGREAGVRTYLLVSLGSALIMVVSDPTEKCTLKFSAFRGSSR